MLATDGVFDVMDNDRVGQCVCEYLDRRTPGLSAADILTMEAQELWKNMGDDVRGLQRFLKRETRPRAAHR